MPETFDLNSARQEWRDLLKQTSDHLQHLRQGQVDALEELALNLSAVDFYHRKLETQTQFYMEERAKILADCRLLSGFFTEAPIGYIILGENGTVEDVNCVAAEYWNIDRGRFRRLGMLGLIAAEHIQLFNKAFESAKASKQRKTLEVKCVRPRSECFWARFDLILTEEQTSDRRRVLCAVINITTDRLIEDAIKKTTVGLSSSTGASFFRKLADFLVNYQDIDYAVATQYLEGEFKTLAVAAKVGETEPFVFKRPKFENVMVVGINSVTREPDSTSTQPLLSYFAANDGMTVFLFDADRKIAGELSILTRGTFDDRKLFASILKVVSARAAAELQRLRTEQELKDYRDKLEILVESRTADLRKNNIRLAREVEKRKVAQKNLETAKQVAEQASIAKSAFLANMSHEIRTPMNGVIGVINLMEQLELTPKMRNYLDIMKSSGDLLLHVINDILDLSKLESGHVQVELETANLRRLVQSVIDAQKSQAAAKGIGIFLFYSFDIQEEIVSDGQRIRQVVENLLSNAIKFTEKGHIEVCVAIDSISSKLKISVVDSGIGISRDKLELIFEPFSQADTSTTRRYGGTGLGLSISRRIAQILGGTIYCSSDGKTGSTFLFELPIKIDEKPKFQPFSGYGFYLSFKNERLRFLYQQMLISGGGQVLILENPPADIETTFSQPPASVVLISDRLLTAKQLSYIPETIAKTIYVGLANDSVSAGEAASSFCEDEFAFEMVVKLIVKESDRRDVHLSSNSVISELTNNRNLRVLLVEDNEVNRMVAVDMLVALGTEVDVAVDGLEAVEKTQNQSFDIVFMDCHMPKMDGFEAVKQIKSRTDISAPVIALTANAMKGDRERCLKSGFDGYLSKPINISDIKAIINQTLEVRKTSK